jgi:hypothetical protein
MLAIQIVLVIMALALFFLFTQRAHTVRTQAVKRIGFVLFIFGGIYAILRPQDVNWIAHKLGVGRGADLVLYLLVVVVAFFAANTFLRFRNLERRFTDLARSVALSNAVMPAPRRESDALAAVETAAGAPSTGSDSTTGTTGTDAAEAASDAGRPVPAGSGRQS